MAGTEPTAAALGAFEQRPDGSAMHPALRHAGGAEEALPGAVATLLRSAGYPVEEGITDYSPFAEARLALVSLTPLLPLPFAGVVGPGGWSTMNVPVSSEPVTCWSVLEPADSITSSREFSVVMPLGLPGPAGKIQKIKGKIPQPGGFLRVHRVRGDPAPYARNVCRGDLAIFEVLPGHAVDQG